MFSCLHLLLSFIRCVPISPLFPYTTLFRSRQVAGPTRAIYAQSARRCCAATSLYRASKRCATTAGSRDRKSTRLNSSHTVNSYAVFCLKKKNVHITHL